MACPSCTETAKHLLQLVLGSFCPPSLCKLSTHAEEGSVSATKHWNHCMDEGCSGKSPAHSRLPGTRRETSATAVWSRSYYHLASPPLSDTEAVCLSSCTAHIRSFSDYKPAAPLQLTVALPCSWTLWPLSRASPSPH